MPKTPPPAEFKIHVDGSCLTDSTDLGKLMAPERVASGVTVVHHDSWPAERDEKPAAPEPCGENEQAIEDDEPREGRNAHEHSEDEARERQIDRIEAQIQAAARAVVASIEKDHYRGNEESVLSTGTDESFEQEGSQMTYDEGTELTYESTELTYDGTQGTYESEHEPHYEHEGEGDSSSHHDGDIDDDDVFSRNSGHSQRSSLNSLNELSSADEVLGKGLNSPPAREEAVNSSPTLEEPETMSRIPSNSSYTPRDRNPITPSKVQTRPPFRTPSSVRAIQMSSPTPSLFSSPRSSKRHLPTVSRIGTPNSTYNSPTKNRTPRRFKVQKDEPLVLLHATVIPLSWNYSHVISSPELPLSLAGVRENWRLLQEKLGDTVLERGILLPHPQDSYEILEERLLEALELPVRPRAKILKCGHYLGPETPSSDEEGRVIYFEAGVKKEGERRWCDICRRDVRLEMPEFRGREGERRFRIKIYASNGLMTAGSWHACWKQMESIDVELEPFVEPNLVPELDHLAAVTEVEDAHPAQQEEDGFEDVPPSDQRQHEFEANTAEEGQARAEEEHMRAQAEDAATMRRKLMEEEDARRAQEVDEMARKIMEEERRREIYGHDIPDPPTAETSSRPSARAKVSSRAAHDDDSLPDLLVKAFKVAMRDKKNVAICVLSILVLLLALNTGNSTTNDTSHVIRDSGLLTEVVMDSGPEPVYRQVESEAKVPANTPETVQEVRKKRPVVEKVACYEEVPSFEVVEKVERVEPMGEPEVEDEKVTPASLVESPNLPSEPAAKQPLPEPDTRISEEKIEGPIQSSTPLEEIFEEQTPQVEV